MSLGSTSSLSEQRRGLVGSRPLLGYGSGKFRIHIVGNSGAGKSTLARELATMLDLPCILLDTLHWAPGWRERPVDEFRTIVRAAMVQDPRGWVIDGNYTSKLGTIVSDEATDIIWLDPPLLLYFPRICLRTLRRLLRLSPPCSPGCDESFREVFFSKDSIIWWSLSHHRSTRKREAERHRLDGVHRGGKHRRIGGWGGELAAWKREVLDMVGATRAE